MVVATEDGAEMGEQHFLKLGQQRFRAQPASSQAASRGQPTDLIGQHLYCATVAHRQGHLNAALPTENLSLAKSAPAVDTLHLFLPWAAR